MCYKVGMDVGSTTVKIVAVNDQNKIIYKNYKRHFSKIQENLALMLSELAVILGDAPVKLAVAGSAGMGIAKSCHLPFVQEVYALTLIVEKEVPDADVVIELGGEDAKIIFLTGGLEERMNGTCAGGTGAFIDQMATLLDISAEELDRLSLEHEKIYEIASRCGVFAKSDIQPLLNQGANKKDIAASIFQAVVDQTITGLAQGRKIEGKVLFLGGPLSYFEGLRQRFAETLKLRPENALFPKLGKYFVAMGSAVYGGELPETFSCGDLIRRIENLKMDNYGANALPALFKDPAEYAAFCQHHAQDQVPLGELGEYKGNVYLGIDVGSTTTKMALIGEDNSLLHSFYTSNKGNPITVVLEELKNIYGLLNQNTVIAGSAVTGYGEDLIKNAFGVDLGVVETVAHFSAAKYFNPQVDFIIDIGGQDIKCFKIKNNTIDHIMLNEACSSGCGSFIQSFAKALGYGLDDFSALAIFAVKPVDLGSRCTVFMNSSVKQAQRDGATVQDISAGLAVSVVKNAIYKVIRATSPGELGKNIVVQGGTFLNDAILRSFEQELGVEVVRPVIAGLMGAFGAALYAKERVKGHSTLIGMADLEKFVHTAKAVTCHKCNNRCNLTINTFANASRFVSGNKCELGAGGKTTNTLPNLYQYKLDRIEALTKQTVTNPKGRIGIPLALNMYENIPLWHTLFTELGFQMVYSEPSSRKLYVKGQYSIPSDTVCYPAKLVHGHIESLLDQGVDAIFYPCMSYNFQQGETDNHFNCPVVAYYPELLRGNVLRLKETKFLMPYLDLNNYKLFIAKMAPFFKKEFEVSKEDLEKALQKAYSVYSAWREDIKAEGQKAIKYARRHNRKIIVLAGRPYHVDREINHSIDKLFCSLGFVVITEDSVAHLMPVSRVNVLNQWTYHSRLYNAAAYVATQPDMELVQLVSFGCGLDAITTDEVRDILEENGKLYTQLKIDEINNLAAVKIRARSLLAAMQERE